MSDKVKYECPKGCPEGRFKQDRKKWVRVDLDAEGNVHEEDDLSQVDVSFVACARCGSEAREVRVPKAELTPSDGTCRKCDGKLKPSSKLRYLHVCGSCGLLHWIQVGFCYVIRGENQDELSRVADDIGERIDLLEQEVREHRSPMGTGKVKSSWGPDPRCEMCDGKLRIVPGTADLDARRCEYCGRGHNKDSDGNVFICCRPPSDGERAEAESHLGDKGFDKRLFDRCGVCGNEKSTESP